MSDDDLLSDMASLVTALNTKLDTLEQRHNPNAPIEDENESCIVTPEQKKTRPVEKFENYEVTDNSHDFSPKIKSPEVETTISNPLLRKKRKVPPTTPVQTPETPISHETPIDEGLSSQMMDNLRLALEKHQNTSEEVFELSNSLEDSPHLMRSMEETERVLSSTADLLESSYGGSQKDMELSEDASVNYESESETMSTKMRHIQQTVEQSIASAANYLEREQPSQFLYEYERKIRNDLIQPSRSFLLEKVMSLKTKPSKRNDALLARTYVSELRPPFSPAIAKHSMRLRDHPDSNTVSRTKTDKQGRRARKKSRSTGVYDRVRAVPSKNALKDTLSSPTEKSRIFGDSKSGILRKNDDLMELNKNKKLRRKIAEDVSVYMPKKMWGTVNWIEVKALILSLPIYQLCFPNVFSYFKDEVGPIEEIHEYVNHEEIMSLYVYFAKVDPKKKKNFSRTSSFNRTGSFASSTHTRKSSTRKSVSSGK
ncbi:hypothetical protein PCE1_003513 [Barthelona sp. PCE]